MEPSWILIEGGGSRTRVAVTGAGPASLDGPSTNPRSGGAAHALSTLQDLVSRTLSASNTTPASVDLVVAAHGAASTAAAAEEFAHLLRSALSGCGVGAAVVVTTDILPLLFGAERQVAVAAIVGTGTDFLARRADRFTAASGLDYLLTDEGGGFDLGLQGLRAVSRALDGRGPATNLVDEARRWCDAPPLTPLRDALFDKVYDGAARPVVAAFARFVVESAQLGDPIAAAIVSRAVDEVLLGIAAVLAGVGATDEPFDLVLSGSLATTDNHYRSVLLGRVAQSLPTAAITMHGTDLLTTATQRLGHFILAHTDNLAYVRQAGPFVFLPVA